MNTTSIDTTNTNTTISTITNISSIPSSEACFFGRGTVRVCRRGAIVVVAFYRPHAMNAFDDALYLDLIDILQQTAAVDDNSIAALIFTGTGNYFSSGADLKQVDAFAEHNSNNSNSSNYNNSSMLSRPSGRFMMELIQYPKVIAAAVQGPAVGIGMTMLMHCDIVHCTPQATFWAPFTRLALVPELCSSVLLRETMGLSKANEMLLLGRKINAKEALEYGIVSRIVDCSNNNNNNNTDAAADPFDKNSLASHLCAELDERLLSLPHGTNTAAVFVSLMRGGGSRRQRLQQVCLDELRILDQRFQKGHVRQAAQQLKIGSANKNNLKSKL